ncbi:hypothetical protein H5410_047712 [Solanum commersonii]|uniref:Uncharacterized protein n=1 Tax=Solanum commersonii TaxID=4109 RepID=A0A9J5XJH3_SOLCO|nr:hypothetical protein H5410_047712 [Solanum commersonii]
MEEEGGARKSPRRSPRILSDVGTSNQKLMTSPNFSLGISQESGEQNKGAAEQGGGEKQGRQQRSGTKHSPRRRKMWTRDGDFDDLPLKFSQKIEK